MKPTLRRMRANYHYLRKPFLAFLPLLSFLVLTLLLGSVCFHHLYRQGPLSYVEALYITYCLVLMEHLVDFPEHWILRIFYFVLPLLGLVVILDGFVRFGYHVMRNSGNSRVNENENTYKNSSHHPFRGIHRVTVRGSTSRRRV